MPQAASRMIHNMLMRVPVPVLVPYRTAAGHHGLRIMDRSLNACKTFHSKNQCSIYGSGIVKLFIAKIHVRFMDRSLNVCKTFHDKINVRFMDRSLNACKTFHSKNQCSIYGSVIECM